MTELVQLTERLTSRDRGVAPWLWRCLLRLLAEGHPVAVEDVAHAAGRPVDDVRRGLAAMPDTEYDQDGRILGYGLSLRPSPHRFEVDGRNLYTWCALDTLIFPAILGRPARVESPCRVTGAPVRVTVDTNGVTSIDPATAVISLVNPDNLVGLQLSDAALDKAFLVFHYRPGRVLDRSQRVWSPADQCRCW